MTEPKIYTKNYVNQDCPMTVDLGAASILNLCDRDKASQWQSVGAASDATRVIITVPFYEGTVPVNRTFDTVMFINHNLATYTVDYWNGSAWVQIVNRSVADVTPNCTLYNAFGSVTAPQIRVIAISTQTANQEKAIGELVVTALQMDIGTDLSSYSVTYRQKIKQLVMGDGSLQQALVFWSPYRCEKYEATAGFVNLTQGQLNALSAIKETGQPFLWYPESIQRPDEVWLVNWTNPLTWQYSGLYKPAGIDLSMELKEV